MGAVESKKVLGEKVLSTKQKLENDISRIGVMHEKICKTNRKFLECFFDTLQNACVKKHPITDETVLICFKTDALRTQGLLLATVDTIFGQQYVYTHTRHTYIHTHTLC